MENVESIWQVGIIALLAGGLIGALAYRLLAPSLTKAEQVRSDLEAARQELIDYKASVNSHFDKTSELVNDLTQNYVKVYQHLAEGAQTLGDSRQLNNLLEQQQGKVLLTVDDAPEVAAAPPDSDQMKSTPAVGESIEVEEHSADSAERSVAASAKTKISRAESETAGSEASTAAADGGAIDETVEQAAQTEAAPEGGEGGPKAARPRIDVTKIKETAAGDGEAETELGKLIPDPDKGPGEVKPTRH